MPVKSTVESPWTPIFALIKSKMPDKAAQFENPEKQFLRGETSGHIDR